MRRLALPFALLGAVALVVLATGLLTRGPAEDRSYRVRAIFDDAPVNVGADVLVAGVAVGRVSGLDLTPDHKAALTLTIEDKRFVPFHSDAICGTRPQSLIGGERAVVCEAGTGHAGTLPAIRAGAGSGAHLLPVERTSSSVDLDVVNAIWRRPANEQLAVLLSELGAGTAARGADLGAIIHRANPGLGETDRVLAILAGQTRALQQMSVDGERVLKPLAARRRALVGFIAGSQRAGAAAARHTAAFGATLAKLAPTLRSLGSTMTELHAFAAQSTPVLARLADGAPALSRATAALPAFAARAVPAVRQLGTTARAQRADLPRLLPLSATLTRLGGDLAAPARNLAALTTSLRDNAAIPNLLATVFGAASAANGFDQDGHVLRSEVLSGACGQYTNGQFFGCDAQFGDAKISGSAASVRTAPRASAEDALLDYLLGSGA